ncbi:redox-sensitive transcriptional activator SoxR [Qipengyuania citrea]|jgi:MerR family transcriptional regulator, redox-sensitive transcriptional activator SoxR|uniref:Redox-sensitive transcriptional activator SoxR n=2 Tax=Qipengyuania TaxID=1855416 RepID=A0ABY4U3E7_9SPHN|nr:MULTISPECIES: redox-sensitive transcriptional activator SoxR [Erythrobacteraceae]MAB45014.1 redox-sensitive transcriptional activator SoxR [Sphingomonadaceae bacterium]MAG41517.1 redox-sensitive transcriptional activator SoxR [Erythrobacteraceae bacterium]MCH2498456.1 redox-sensitive transcriptional activator SoxR [Erythrobacter sp.]MEE2794219.1 redox-sensitive transcriptional activator SoxR [Pseudomonadota bacterium]MAQ65663.1 redox-sensitive transcriptional activator SoxR [Sphingomonadace|tara:strand:- start:518 stop:955 length:438 start_codon:yes stop_codon:yes gene_type:complete
MNPNDLLTIGDLARRTGLTPSAIRFYEDKGLLQSHRTGGNQRRFLRSDIRRLSFILIVQKLGLSLEEIGEHLRSLPQGRTPSSFDWWKISEAIRESLDRRIAQLQSLRDNLDGCIGCGCLSLKTCKLYNPDDVAAEGGPGPRVLR